MSVVPPSPQLLFRCLVGFGLLTFAGACGPDTTEVTAPDADAGPAVTPPPVEAGDLAPPTFAGVQRIALVGENRVRLSWDPATDDVTPSPQLRYEVFHAAELFRLPADGDAPTFTSEPGQTSVDLEVDRAGRFYVRAVDAAGRASPLHGSLYQRVSRPIVSALDGRPFSQVSACEEFEPGRAMCVGPDGFAARWDRDHWTPLQLPDGMDWKFTRQGADLFLYSDVGHLYRFMPNDPPEPLTVRFEEPLPQTPFAQFSVDALGLMYWLDAVGDVWVGVPGDFRRMRHPLALPVDEGCTQLRQFLFSDTAGFAVCLDGAVYSTRYGTDGLRWMPLTVNTPDDVAPGALGILARDDTGGIVVQPDGLRRVGVGGWQPVVVVGRSLDPLDPNAPAITHVGQVVSWGDDIVVATNLGLLRGPEGFLDAMPGTDGDVAGFVRPTSIESEDTLRLVYRDASVVRLDGSRRTWEVRPMLTGFVTGGLTTQGVLIGVTADEVYRLTDGEWAPTGPPPAMGDPALALSFVSEDAAGGGLLAAGTSTEGFFFVRRTGGGWSAEPLGARDIEGEARAAEAAIEAAARAAARAPAPDPTAPPAPPPPPEPLPDMLYRSATDEERAAFELPIDFDSSADGRGVMVTAHTVWWRVADGWIPLVRREGTIDAVALDGGPGYILIEDGLPIRCVRDVCEEGVAEAADAPMGLRAVWRTPSGLQGLQGDASVVQFEPSTEVGPWSDIAAVPAGRWVPVVAAPPEALPNGEVAGRRIVGETDLLWLTDGRVYSLHEGRWVLQGSIPEGYAFWSDGDRWGILGRQGLLTLAPVADATY
jgi:hypothetical protein